MPKRLAHMSPQLTPAELGYIGFYVEPRVKAILLRLAKQHDRSISSLLRQIVTDFANQDHSKDWRF